MATLGKFSFNADGLQAILNTPSDSSATAFTLVIQLALSLLEGNFGRNKTTFSLGESSLRIDYDFLNVSDVSLTVHLEQSDDLEFYKFQWSKPFDEVLHYLKDKIELGDAEGAKWYGGAMVRDQAWPIQTWAPFGSKKTDVYSFVPFVLNDIYQADATGQERYWLCSKKILLSVPWSVPLWSSISNGTLALQSQVKDSPFLLRNNFLEYELVVPKSVGLTLQQFHSKCFAKYLKCPIAIPDTLMMEKPVWSTWALYWSNVTQNDVLELGKKVAEHNFPASQLELDDRWTSAYGDYKIDTEKFPNFQGMIEELKKLGIPRLTAWVHPFVNVDSENGKDQRLRKFWLKDFDGRVVPSKWWNGLAYVVDMTNPEAVDWFREQLKNMQKLGIFTFKFDAGESNFMPKNYALHSGQDPNEFGHAYTRLIAEFGPAVENRFGARTQEYSVFMRTMDRNSEWVLTASLHGYFWNLPDMIGGNGKFVGDEPNRTREDPDKEIYIRWAQANAFLLAMQFSFTPWQFDKETVDICRSVLELRQKWMSYIMECTQKAVSEKAPVIRPMWWVSDAPEAFACSDQYLVGDRLLVAPVVEEGATARKVFLPAGKWRDGNSGNVTEGPTTIEVNAPLEVLPFFELVTSPSSGCGASIVGSFAKYIISFLIVYMAKSAIL